MTQIIVLSIASIIIMGSKVLSMIEILKSKSTRVVEKRLYFLSFVSTICIIPTVFMEEIFLGRVVNSITIVFISLLNLICLYLFYRKDRSEKLWLVYAIIFSIISGILYIINFDIANSVLYALSIVIIYLWSIPISKQAIKIIKYDSYEAISRKSNLLYGISMGLLGSYFFGIGSKPLGSIYFVYFLAYMMMTLCKIKHVRQSLKSLFF